MADSLRRRVARCASLTTRHLGALLLGLAVLLGVASVAPQANAQPVSADTQRQGPIREVPQWKFAPGTWRSGSSVKVTLTGLVPGKRYAFQLQTSGRESDISAAPLLRRTVVPNRSGAVTVTFRWPSTTRPAPFYTVNLSDGDSFGTSRYVVSAGGRWVPRSREPYYRIDFSSPKWRSGDRVTLTATGVAAGKPVEFTFRSLRGEAPLTTIATWRAMANRNGVAKVTVTWPTTPVQREALYRLTTTDGIGLQSWSPLIDSVGTWGLGPDQPFPVTIEPATVSPGSSVLLTLTARGAESVEFRVTAWRGDTPTRVATWTAPVSDDSAELTVTWPPDSAGTEVYSVEAVDSEGVRYVSWLRRDGSGWTWRNN